MNDIRRVLRRAAWRVWFTALGRALTVAAAAVLAGLIVLRLVQRAVGLAVPWQDVAVWSAVGGAALALAWTIIARADRAAVARRVDEGADLREALSTALCIERNEDPWSRMALETAAERARTVDVKRAVPIQPPRFWPVPLALAMSLVVVWLAVPPMDLFGHVAQSKQREEEKARIVEVKTRAEEIVKKIESLVPKVDQGKEENREEAEANKPEARTPEEIRRDALRKLTNIKDQLQELKQGEKGQKMEALEKMLKQLRTPGEGPLTELSKELSKGNFKQAAEELQKLSEQLSANQMSDEDKKALGEQLKKLQEQLEKLAQDRSELEKALEKSGLDKKLAANPEALKQALENAQNLSQEQKEQLQKMAESMNSACEQCQSMSQSMQQMAKQMGQQGENGEQSSESMEGMESLANQLAQLEQMQSELESADAAMEACEQSMAELASFAPCENPGMGECEGGLGEGVGEGEGMWREGWGDQAGDGSGGPGRGRGGQPQAQEADYTMEKKKVRTNKQGGPIISSRMVEGEQIRGESKAEFRAAVTAAEQSAAEALDSNVIPREYHDAVKHYFGRLKAKAQAEEVKAPQPAAPAANDAGGEKSGDGK